MPFLQSLRSWFNRESAPMPVDYRPTIEHGEAGIRSVGHRDYVGGLWDVLGPLQFRFLIEQGLRPGHHFLDVGCGCLRGGVHFVPYLDPGHYHGIDKESALIEAGLRCELNPALVAERQPDLRVSGNFDFSAFGVSFDYALAQSLFTHLPESHIRLCLERLRPCMSEAGIFFATFFECARPRRNPTMPHDHGFFAYTREELERLGRSTGWQADYLGDWNHPRGQRMMRFRGR